MIPRKLETRTYGNIIAYGQHHSKKAMTGVPVTPTFAGIRQAAVILMGAVTDIYPGSAAARRTHLQR
jgi:hypothetical protein